MARVSHREKLLDAGLGIVHRRGFGAASVRDIVRAAGVPQGSFTNHFASKEAFALDILDRYVAERRAFTAQTLDDQSRPPLDRLRAYVTASRDRLAEDGMRNGCLLGNLSAEVADASEVIRLRLAAVFADAEASLAACLRAAVAAGEVAPDLDCDEVAGFVLSSLQGATLIAKVERSPAAVDRLERVLFSIVLRPPA